MRRNKFFIVNFALFQFLFTAREKNNPCNYRNN
uniref:Uncharacterized protein n=1 Tax=Siphoviridae sp. ctqK313 TaxID=2827946 RepID=A0A8S5TB86_9CAUD|nr:MAG TPA: hypothetical protein [Siphoviridae sp. ctqK313]